MLYREMKKIGDALSILGFGCMRLPQKKGSPGSGRIDEARATRQILHAIEHGVNYFDTAMPYHMGASEPFLGRALAGGMGGEPACASLCENCGQCEDACPQHLPVQELLKEVAQTFEKWWLRPAVWLIQRAFAAHRWVTLRRARRNVGRG